MVLLRRGTELRSSREAHGGTSVAWHGTAGIETVVRLNGSEVDTVSTSKGSWLHQLYPTRRLLGRCIVSLAPALRWAMRAAMCRCRPSSTSAGSSLTFPLFASFLFFFCSLLRLLQQELRHRLRHMIAGRHQLPPVQAQLLVYFPQRHLSQSYLLTVVVLRQSHSLQAAREEERRGTEAGVIATTGEVESHGRVEYVDGQHQRVGVRA